MQEASTLRGAADIQFTTFPTSPTISWLQSHFDTGPAAYAPIIARSGYLMKRCFVSLRFLA